MKSDMFRFLTSYGSHGDEDELGIHVQSKQMVKMSYSYDNFCFFVSLQFNYEVLPKLVQVEFLASYGKTDKYIKYHTNYQISLE